MELFLLLCLLVLIGLVVWIHIRVGEVERENRRLWEALQKPRPRLEAPLPAAGSRQPVELPRPGEFVAAEDQLRDAQAPVTAEAAASSTSSEVATTPPPKPPISSLPPRRPRAERGKAPAQVGERRPPPLSLEAFLGGRVLLVVGVIVVLFGLAFFLKYAIEQELIDARTRVIIGVIAGLAAIVGGDRLRHRGFDIFGHAMMGGGLGALYLSIYFASVRYGFVGRYPAHALTAVVTAGGAYLAVRRGAPLLAYLGIAAAFLAPAMLSVQSGTIEQLTGWLVVVDLGVLAVLWMRNWQGLDVMTQLASTAYYASWLDAQGSSPPIRTASVVLAVLVAASLAVSLVPALARRRAILPTSLFTALGAGLLAATAGFHVLYPDDRFLLGCGLLVLALVYFVAGRVAAVDRDEPVLFGLGIAVAAAAVPAFFEGRALPPAFAAAGAAAVFIGAQRRMHVFTVEGVLLILLGLGRAVYEMPMHDAPFAPFVNGAFFSFAAPSVALVLAGGFLWWRTPWRVPAGLLIGAGLWTYAPFMGIELYHHFDLGKYGRNSDLYGLSSAVGSVGLFALILAWFVRHHRGPAGVLPLGPLATSMLFALPLTIFVREQPFLPFLNPVFVAVAAVAAAGFVSVRAQVRWLGPVVLLVTVAFGFVVLGIELGAWGEEAKTGVLTRRELRQRAWVWMSVAWSLYAATLLVTGFALRRADLRWAGIAAFFLTLLKVFFVDMRELPTVSRIGGFLVLGVLLVAASFLYQRVRAVIEPQASTGVAEGLPPAVDADDAAPPLE